MMHFVTEIYSDTPSSDQRERASTEVSAIYEKNRSCFTGAAEQPAAAGMGLRGVQEKDSSTSPQIYITFLYFDFISETLRSLFFVYPLKFSFSFSRNTAGSSLHIFHRIHRYTESSNRKSAEWPILESYILYYRFIIIDTLMCSSL